MPRLKTFGDRMTAGTIGPRQVAAIPASKVASPPIQTMRYARNGKHPDTSHINSQLEAGNQAALFRTKEVARFCGRMAVNNIIPSFGAGDRARWRFACHTGPYTHALLAIVCLVPQSTGAAENSYGRLDIFTDTAESVLLSQTKFYYGNNPGGTGSVSIGWQYLKPVFQYIDVSPDTDYYGRFVDVDWGRIQSATVFELPSLTENFSGYLPQNLSAQSNILDVYRQNLATMAYNLWRRSAATVFNWSVDDGTAPITIAGATATNIVDVTSTAINANTPGYTLNMQGKDRLSQTTGVPVTMKVFCKTNSATFKGRIYLKNSSGTAVLQITDGISPAGSWLTATGVLTAGTAKYDPMFDNNGSATLSLYAMSVYEYE